MQPRFYMEEDVDDVEPVGSQEVNGTETATENNQPQTPIASRRLVVGAATTPENNHQLETPTTSSSTLSKRKTSPRDDVRRQTLCPSRWKVNVSKTDFNAGKMHVTPKRVLKRAKALKEGCHDKCRKCSRRLLPEEREELHALFWNLSDVRDC